VSAATRALRVAVIPGDGVGTEVIPAALTVIAPAAERAGARLETTTFPWGSTHHARTGRMMDEDALDQLRAFDAIFLGAVGDPSVPDHVTVWEMILPIRQRFDQYVNLRPMRLLAGVDGPLAGRVPADVDMVCVRENAEGEYGGVGGRIYRGTADEIAQESAIFTRRGIERVVRYAFEIAAHRPRHLLASATKSNALRHSMVLWDEVVEAVAPEYPAVTVRRYHARRDRRLQPLRRHPERSRRGHRRQPRPGPGGEREPRAKVSFHVRAHPRFGARHRGTRHRQSGGRHLGGGDDAGSRGGAGGARPDPGCDRARARGARGSHPRPRRRRRDGRDGGGDSRRVMS
jgi:hypothetical protein